MSDLDDLAFVSTEHLPEGEALLIGTDAFDPPEDEDAEAWMAQRVVRIVL